MTRDAIPRIRNKAKLKPIELVDPRNKDLRSVIQRAEYSLQVGDDVVHEDDEGGGVDRNGLRARAELQRVRERGSIGVDHPTCGLLFVLVWTDRLSIASAFSFSRG